MGLHKGMLRKDLIEIQKTASLLPFARLKCLWFFSGVGFSRHSNFPEEGESAISGRIKSSKPARGAKSVKELPGQKCTMAVTLLALEFPECFLNEGFLGKLNNLLDIALGLQVVPYDRPAIDVLGGPARTPRHLV
jgi:hypothetical protein